MADQAEEGKKRVNERIEKTSKLMKWNKSSQGSIVRARPGIVGSDQLDWLPISFKRRHCFFTLSPSDLAQEALSTKALNHVFILLCFDTVNLCVIHICRKACLNVKNQRLEIKQAFGGKQCMRLQNSCNKVLEKQQQSCSSDILRSTGSASDVSNHRKSL